MRIAIYNRWLPIQGGGERYSLALAQTLAQRHSVTLITHQPVDLAAIGQFLELDLAGLQLAVVPYTPTGRPVSARSQHFDGFVGATHSDIVVPQSRRSAVVVFFPRALASPAPAPVAGQDWFPAESGPRGPLRWSAATAQLRLQPALAARRLALHVAGPPAGTTVQLRCGALERVYDLAATPRWITIPVPTGATSVELTTAPFRAPPDPRELGIMLQALRLTGALWPYRVHWQQGAAALALDPALSHDVLAGYQQIIGISAFTCGWIKRRWQLPAELLWPAVPAVPAATGPRTPLILSVGRFFPGGHAKQHRLLIAAFQQLVGELPAGWRLALVGGLDPAEPSHVAYFAELAASIGDTPITLHPNLPAAELAQLWQTATIYWHAGGYGVDLELQPELAEHFGITVAQALGAGAIPVVYGAAGPAEIVRHGQDGYHWHTLPELLAQTRRLALDPAEQTRLRAAGRSAATRFDRTAFEQRVWELFGDWR